MKGPIKTSRDSPHTICDDYFSGDMNTDWVYRKGFCRTYMYNMDSFPSDIPGKYMYKKNVSAK